MGKKWVRKNGRTQMVGFKKGIANFERTTSPPSVLAKGLLHSQNVAKQDRETKTVRGSRNVRRCVTEARATMGL